MDTNNPGTEIEEKGWRQGSALPPSLFGEVVILGEWQLDPAKDELFVVTGDCNVVHPRFDHEPLVDVVAATRIDSLDGNYTQRKSPRVLHLEVDRGGAVDRLQFVAWRRGVIGRRSLLLDRPDSTKSIDGAPKRLLADWWAIGRFLRSSFPGEFNRRLDVANGKNKALEKLLKKVKEEIVGVYLTVLPDGDIAEGEEYRAILRVPVEERAFEHTETRTWIEREFYEPFLAKLTAAGIIVENHDLLSEADFSMADFRRMNRLEFEHMSLAGEEEGPIPPR